ncbi:MAG TPA: YncE family protein [Verrucomicrobiae bacterium]|jgi:DNA-binding beta-propeller fold protein YncE|nr:YncE family protein [Verrucomicrobiae bacterium]
MRTLFSTSFLLALLIALSGCKNSQPAAPVGAAPAAEAAPPMILTASVPLEGVKGRFDHFASGKGRVFVSGLGNNSVEIIDLFQGTRAHEITGVPNPQGVAFSPEANKLFVASEKGKVYVYDGDSYKLLNTLDFEGGADNLRYDAATKRVYVGCGDDEKNSAIAAIDAMTGKRTDEVYKLGGEPESFQLEKSGPNIYVNVPELKQIVAINRTTKELTRWTVTNLQNFPMALDEADHRIIVGTREPATVSVFDTTSGKMVASVPTVQDTDDLYYSAEKKRLFVPGREGAIWVYQQSDPDHFTLITKVPTVVGAGTAGYFGRQGKGFDRFYLAVSATANSNAEVRIYTLND